MKLEKFKKSKKIKNILLTLGIAIVILGGGIILYKSYAKYQENKSYNILKGRIGEFQENSLELAMLLDGESISTVPEQKEYENIIVDCGDSATGMWDINTWSVNVGNITNPKVKCSINFIRKDYKEDILNGTDPVLASSLIPVKIADDGTVTKANIKEEWYNYTDKIWANAIILEDETKTYKNDEVIPESNIESYFVWIPRYKYKIWDEGNYNSVTTIDESKVHTIEVEFESKDTSASTGSTVNSWLTHPTFTTFDVNGMWVGKFEPGYKGAKTTAEAQKNESDSTKLQIKPNVYSWRGIQVSNAHLTSYHYKRELDSHMMKNTEWGAVAYLQHSAYGSKSKIRTNNNFAYITGYAAKNEPVGFDYKEIESTSPGVNGTKTFMYNTDIGYLASTTGNITGIYDMSGGSHEYMMGVMTDKNGNPLSGQNSTHHSGFTGTLGCPTCDLENGGDSNITEIQGVPLPETKYYDVYPFSNKDLFNQRILGDAIGELGPFGNITLTLTRQVSSWHHEQSLYISPSYPWYKRSGEVRDGESAGMFYFGGGRGNNWGQYSFRVVLTPQN